MVGTSAVEGGAQAGAPSDRGADSLSFLTYLDLHYWETDDLEWYDPGQATTAVSSAPITPT